MKKRPYFCTAKKVVSFFDRYPTMSSYEIGYILELHPAYIRKVLKRNNRKLLRAPKL